MKTQIRIVAGALRGRKLSVQVNPNLRPTPQMVREALFSILGNAVPDRPFYDVFAGTGVIGLEALSRGAASVTFVERDFRLVADIERLLREWDVAERATVVRADVYRWAERFVAPGGPVNVFFSPPFADLERRPDEFLAAVAAAGQRVAPGSVLVIQSEQHAPLDPLPGDGWERRRYGRNELLLRVKEEPPRQADTNPG
jgi:16S rRNA (guanine966-N2)-methyltransferase